MGSLFLCRRKTAELRIFANSPLPFQTLAWRGDCRTSDLECLATRSRDSLLGIEGGASQSTRSPSGQSTRACVIKAGDIPSGISILSMTNQHHKEQNYRRHTAQRRRSCQIYALVCSADLGPTCPGIHLASYLLRISLRPTACQVVPAAPAPAPAFFVLANGLRHTNL